MISHFQTEESYTIAFHSATAQHVWQLLSPEGGRQEQPRLWRGRDVEAPAQRPKPAAARGGVSGYVRRRTDPEAQGQVAEGLRKLGFLPHNQEETCRFS